MKFSKIITFAIVLSTIGVTHAEWMDESSVKTAAEAFTVNDPIGSTILKGCTVAGLTQRQNLWIVSLEPSGHIVMSGSDLADPIIGFSKNNFTDPDPDSPAYAMLEGASASVAAKEAQGGTRHARWMKLLGSRGRPLLMAGPEVSPDTVEIEPFLKSHYNQCQPYNDYAPVYDSATDTTRYRGRCPCGCVATATAQVLRHFRWPARIDRVDSFDHKFTNTNNVENTFPLRFDGHLPIDWAELEDNYIFYASDSYDLRGTVKEYTRYPIARLVMFSDVLAQMSFTSDGSGAGYDTVADNISEWYVKGNWVDLNDGAEQIKADIMAGIPCHISIAAYDENKQRTGHQVIAHGWAESGSTKYLYLNFGWGGSNDGYYNLADDIQEYTEKQAYIGHYPRAKPQLDPLPKVCETSTTLNWHFPDFYTNNLSGFTVSISRPATTPSTFLDDFSESSGTPSSDLFAVGEDSLGYDGNLLYALSNLGSSYFTFPGKYTLTSASVLTFKLRSYYALGNSFEVQARFNDGDWITILEPALFASGDSGWLTERVYLGEHGGETVQLRLFKTFPGGSFYPNTKCILVDDFTVTDVLAQDTPEIRKVGKTARSLTLTGLDAGATYSFTVTPSISGALVDGETSESVSTSIAGTRNTPIPGEQTYTPSTLTFSASDTSGTWSYLGSAADDTSISNGWNCSVTCTIPGEIMQTSTLSFDWTANDYYGIYDNIDCYDVLSATFKASDGTESLICSINNTLAQTSRQSVSCNLAPWSGETGKIIISYSHIGAGYGRGGVIYTPQITDILVPSVPDVAWKEETLTALGTPEILSVSSVTEGFYRECGLGATTFEVTCSESVTSLTARPSHLALVSDEDVSVTPNGNDRFTVTITPVGITDESSRSRIILTLAATDANGTTTYKDLSLRFSNETQEEYVDAETEVVAGIEWTYTVVDGEASIGGDSYSNPAVQRLTEGDITVPSTLGGYSVTRIGPYAFYNCKKITSITVPDSVTSIGSFAFSGCSGLASVFMEGNCPSVDSDAFANVANGCVVLLPWGNETYTVTDGKWQGMTAEWHCEHGGGTSIQNAMDPTCTGAGYTGDKVCGICGEILESGSSIPPLEHVLVETKMAKAPSCTADGWTHEVSCSRCTEVLEASAGLPPLGHDYIETTAAKEPTYFEDGWTHEIVCSRCDAIYEASVTIPKLVPHIEFVVTDVKADEAEGSSVEIRVFGGNLDAKSDVNLYLSYNTAAAADLDLAKGAIDGVTPKGGLKFPLTLSWNMGEIREKVITIPVKADKAVEGDEFFTLLLAAPVGMELGDTTICTVTIHDPGYDDLEAKVKSGTATKAEKSAWDKLQNAKAPYVLGLAEPADAGKVAGSGLCANGKKVTLKATANKGFVFMDWCDATGAKVAPTATLVVDRTAKPAASTATSTTLTDVDDDTTYYAKFITVEEDRASITLKLLGEDLDSPSVAPTALATNVTCGVALEWPLAAAALSTTTVKVTGLPAGLKFADKDVLDSKTKQVIVKANTIYGAPTAASAVDKKTGLTKPSEVKITVTTAGKSSVTYMVKLTVYPLPSWAVGTFDGEVEGGGIVQAFTVATNGKISGKILKSGSIWALSAASFDMVEGSSFFATVIGKAGKEIVTNEVAVASAVVDDVEFGMASSDGWSAWQNLWSRHDTKSSMPVLKKSVVKTVELDAPGDVDNVLTLTFKANGVVSFAGKIAGSAVSGSSQLVFADDGNWHVTLYAPPKGSFPGWCATISVALVVGGQNVVIDVVDVDLDL